MLVEVASTVLRSLYIANFFVDYNGTVMNLKNGNVERNDDWFKLVSCCHDWWRTELIGGHCHHIFAIIMAVHEARPLAMSNE